MQRGQHPNLPGQQPQPGQEKQHMPQPGQVQRPGGPCTTSNYAGQYLPRQGQAPQQSTQQQQQQQPQQSSEPQNPSNHPGWNQ